MGILDAPARSDVRGDRYGTKATTVLQPFRAALAARGSSPCNILVHGDSTDEGTGIGTASTDRSRSWPAQLGYLLRNRFPTTGETISSAPNFVPVQTTSTVPTGITMVGTWGIAQNFGANAYAARSQVNGNTLTFTTPVGTSAFDVHFVGGTSMTGFTVTVDGGAASATQTGSGSTADGKTYRTAVSAGSTHSVVITMVGTNNYVGGIAFYQGNETAGIRVFDVAKHGSAIDKYLPGGSYSSWITTNPPPSTTLAGIQSMIPFSPDLIIIGGAYNDLNSSAITPAQHATNLQTFIAANRAMFTKTVPVLIVSKYVPAAGWTSSTAATWADFVAARAGVAAADANALHIDFTSLMPADGSALATTYGLYTDIVHANAKGYQMVADTIASFIAP